MEAMTVEEVAKALGVGIHTVYDLVKQPGFPSIPKGKRYIIPKAAFYAWLSDPQALIKFKAAAR